MAKLIIKKSVEIYNEEYNVGDTVPYVYWKEETDTKELFYPKLSVINEEKGTVTLIPKGRKDLRTYHEIKIDDIEENKDLYRFEYRGISGYYSICNHGIVYAKTPQEAWEQLKDVVLSKQWNKETATWKVDISYVELFYNGLSCPVSHNIFLFPKAYNELNQINNKFNDKEFLQEVANKISKETGISNEYFGILNGHTFDLDFDYMESYMTNCAGNGLFFAIQDNKGYEMWTTSSQNPEKFIKEVSEALLREMNKMKDNDILELS